MNKKRYFIIIAIIIFIFLALFTFANPLNNEEGEPNANRVLDEIEEDDLVNQEQNDKNTEGEKEETVYNNHGVNIQNILRVEDNSYELALNAVIRAEVLLENDKYNIALDLVSKVTDEDKKEELEKRLEKVLDTMELIKLVKELVAMTNNANNKNELNSAREYQVSNEILDRITKLVNETLKESLTDEVGTVLHLLNDESAPVVNIDDEAILKDIVVLDIKEENGFTITLTKEGENSKEVSNGIKISDGIYTLTVKDEAFNEKTITFTVDTVVPIGDVVYSTLEWTNGEVVATLIPSELVTVINNNGSFEYTFEENGTFTFEFEDIAGNIGTVTANVKNIDKENPTINLAGTVGLNKNEYIVEAGTKVTVEDVMAKVTDNVDEDVMIKPYKADLLISNIAEENTYNYDFTNGFKTNYVGRYNIYYEYTDKAGNKATATMLLVMKDTTAPTIDLAGTAGRNSNELRVNQDEIVSLNDVAALVTDNVDGDRTIYPSEIRRYYPSETGKASHSYDATNGFDTKTPGYYTIKYTAMDSSNNISEKEMLLVVKVTKTPEVVDGIANLYGDLTLTDQPFYNNIGNTEEITINGNGKKVTQYVTSENKFNWNGNVALMGNMFSSSNGSKITINNLTFAGTTNSISLGHYLNYKEVGLEATYNFNTELNNVNIIGLNVVSYSSNIAPAVAVYGTATLNNTNIYGTKRSSLETGPNWPIYDLAVVNYTTTTLNNCRIGSIYAWKHAKLIINSGTTVDSINVTLGTSPENIIVEDGAVVDTIVTSSGEMSYSEWKNLNL